MKDVSEEKLIDLAIKGDQDAWSEIYRRYYSRVKRVVAWRKWGFRYSEVQEIIQEVFLELVKALPNFRREASLSTFLTRLSKNKCISQIRKKNALKRAREDYGFVFDEKRGDNEDKLVFSENDMADPESSLIFGEEVEEMIASLKLLSEDCRRIIKKRYFDGFAYQEICDELDLPLGTVCSRLKRCLSRLKKVYNEKFGKVGN